MSIANYIKTIEKDFAAGISTEHTHRPALKSLIESLAKGITATNEPKRIKCGAPDFIVTRGETPLGYMEAKDIGVPLDREEKGEQIHRYLRSLDNFILTDYLEFRWYVRGEHRLTASLGKAKGKGKVRAEDGDAAAVGELLTAFLNAKVPTVNSPKELAVRMAAVAQLIRSAIARAFNEEAHTEDHHDPLHDQLKGFRDVLIHDLTPEQFADMYAQTAAYGLFAARCNVKSSATFTREHAAYDLPKTNPFLRKLFNQIAGPELDERVAWAVDDLAELLNRTDINAILKDFGKRTRQEDPVVHLYETFLAAYDPKLREARGVYYTPEPVVSYIVRSVDHILKTDFKLTDGLANASKVKVKTSNKSAAVETHKVLLLDPATGTGTFLYAVINHIFETFKSNRGMWSGYVSEHLLPRLFGFELLMAPYAVAHLKLGLLLAETGYNFGAEERLRVYLTNTLEEAHEMTNLPLFTQWLAEEANAASKIKQSAPVMVVLGNPPYSGHSANTGAWIKNLLDEYKAGCPELKKPAQAKWLSDDYVKFIRFAQWRIEQTGYGILAFISNHGYLDNPTFRCMRQSLMQTFDDIYVLDLHGNSKKKERAPDGSKDENVFDIQQGVAIGIFVKRVNGKKSTATVRHAHLWGLREIYNEDVNNDRELVGGKYHWLEQNELKTTQWKEIKPEEPYYLYLPRDTALLPEYEAGWKIPSIFSLNGDPAPGIVTTHDEFAISWNETEAVKKVEHLLATNTETEARNIFRLCSQDQWQYERAKNELQSDEWREQVTPMLYRPFDVRWTVFNRNVAVHRRERVMFQMLAGANLGFCTNRQVNGEFRHVLCTRNIINDCAVSLATRERTYLFPLYLYPSKAKATLFDEEESADSESRRPNLAPEFIAAFSKRLGLTFIQDGTGDRITTFGPEDIFNYIYSVFHSPTYRTRYAEFLKMDFPRLPLTSDPKLFRALCDFGAQIVALHLMETTTTTITGFPITGNNTVEAVRYAEPSEDTEPARVWINDKQYFEGVPPEVWNFHVGGYQVANKWLKDRKGRKLTYDELAHYQQVVAALAETIGLMTKIDTAISEHGEWPLR